MAIVLSDLGAQALCNRILNVFPTDKGFTLHLYTNDITAVDTDDINDFAEASGGGYAAITVDIEDWSASIVGGIAQFSATEQSFVFTGALEETVGPPAGTDTVYGYFVTDGDDVMIHSEPLPLPFKPLAFGDTQKVTPRFQLSKGTPT